MSLLDRSVPRLEKAIERYVRRDAQRWTDPGPKFTVRELMDSLLRRGMSEQNAHRVFFDLIAALEPEPCHMTHCKHYGGAGAPMNCGVGRMPGRCTILRDFRMRQDARAAKANGSAT